MNVINNLLVFLVLLLTFMLSAPATYAAPIISEVFPQPDNGPEWIELYNPDDIEIDLDSWTLYDQLSSPAKIHEFTAQIIAPEEYLVIELSSMKLNNSADGVTLYDDAGTKQDAMQYESSTLEKSWSRQALNSSVFVLTTPTPKEQNNIASPSSTPSPSPTPSSSPSSATTPTPTPTPTPSMSPSSSATSSAKTLTNTNHDITITKLYPCPNKDENESLTIKNNQSTPIDLTNWKIRDAQNNFRALSGIIGSNEEKIFTWQQAMLNNAGDEVFVETDQGIVVATASYSSCQKGEVINVSSSHDNSQGNSESDRLSNQDNTLTTLEEAVLSATTNELTSKNKKSPESTSQSADKNQLLYFPNYQLPNLDYSKTVQNPQAQSAQRTQAGKAIYTHAPSDHLSRNSVLSAILGGLIVSIGGVILLYEQKIHQNIAALA